MSKPFQFGEKVGFVSLSHPATLGGVGAGTAGAVSGLIAPGEYEDADGNVKKRSRIGSALRRAFMLGAGGFGAGMAYDYFSPRRGRPDYPQQYDVRTRQPIVNPLLDPQPTDMERKIMESFSRGRVGERTDLHDQLDKPNAFLEERNRALDVKIPQRQPGPGDRGGRTGVPSGIHV
jgi:hypothetical protein